MAGETEVTKSLFDHDNTPHPQTACDRCSAGVMDSENPHMWGDCGCECHKVSGSAGGSPEGTPMADNTDPRNAVLREIAVDVVLADDLSVEEQRDALWGVVRRHTAIAKEALGV